MRNRISVVQVVLLGMATLALVACVRTRVTPFDPTLADDPRTPPEKIRFYDRSQPECAFSEIGRITAQTGPLTTWAGVVRKAREQASKMAGDAIVGIRETTKVSGAVITDEEITATEHTILSGTVIRFSDADCTR